MRLSVAPIPARLFTLRGAAHGGQSTGFIP
ncbi:hypothetical protein AVHM3334_11605 [Acidovorax sp. SUPP3334]|nr:hypothetical protein AVHM3334_11605 [Acidovorax sp. SUPP3334]